METKVLQVFYGKDCLPYKDKERSVHFPIIGAAIQGASNTTKIRFYFDQLVEEDDETTTWVVVSKLPNGKIGSEIVETALDEELNEHYALFTLKNFYTQAKGDLFLSLQGYQGGVQVETDPDTGISQIVGTPTIQATGSIKLAINYATQLVGSGETANINFQKILADLGTKLGIRAYTELVNELPAVGQTNVFYVIKDDPNDPTIANIYVWNETKRAYVWVGDNTLYLGNYYTKEEGNAFESEMTQDVNRINTQISSLQNGLASIANGAPRGVYASLSDLTTADPNHDYIYLTSDNGHWYYWDGSEWADGGLYLSAGSAITEEIEDNGNALLEFINTGKTNKVFDYKDIDVSPTTVTEYFIGNDGTAIEYEGHTDYKVLSIPVNEGEIYHIKGITSSINSYYAFYDSEGPIYNKASDGTQDSYEGIIVVPKGALFLWVSNIGSSADGFVYKVELKPLDYIKQIEISANSILSFLNSGRNNGAFDYKDTSVSPTTLSGYFLGDKGQLIEYAGHTEYQLLQVDVNQGELYHFRAITSSINSFYSLQDSNGNVIFNKARTNDDNEYLEDVIIVPKGATKLYIGVLNPSYWGSCFVYKVELIGKLQKISSILLSFLNTGKNNGAFDYSDTSVTSTTMDGYFLGDDGQIIDIPSDTSYKLIRVECNEGDIFHIQSTVISINSYFAFHDALGNVLYKENNANDDAPTFEGIIIAPQGVKYLYVSYRSSGDPTGFVYKPEITPNAFTQQKWVGKKWVCMGDSLTESNLRATKNYHDYVHDATGITVDNMGHSGAGYMRSNNDGYAFYQRASAVPLDADVITIFGSGNDLGGGFTLGDVTDTGTSTICGCINTTLDNLLNRFVSNGKLPVIGVITPTPWVGSTPDIANNSMAQYCEKLIECCRRKSIPVLDLYHESNLHPDNSAFRALAYSHDEGNGVHPDENGHKIIAPMFEAFLDKLLLS